MGWIFANLFLLVLVLVCAGYTWLAFAILKLVYLDQNLLSAFSVCTVALVMTYFTMKYAHRWIARRI